MEELGIAADVYARLMGQTLAMMHWIAEVDANDIEFVLAPARDRGEAGIRNTLGGHCLWLLDFDCCRSITMDEAGVKQAVAAFFKNDPYYSQPLQPLWQVFRQAYLDIARLGMEDGRDELEKFKLAEMFINRIEAA